MNVAELKELLNTLPDDAEVIVSEKFGRGGAIQDYRIGELNEDGDSIEEVHEPGKIDEVAKRKYDKYVRDIDAIKTGNAKVIPTPDREEEGLLTWVNNNDGEDIVTFHEENGWADPYVIIPILELNRDDAYDMIPEDGMYWARQQLRSANKYLKKWRVILEYVKNDGTWRASEDAYGMYTITLNNGMVAYEGSFMPHSKESFIEIAERQIKHSLEEIKEAQDAIDKNKEKMQRGTVVNAIELSCDF